MAQPMSFTFGVEIELVLRPKESDVVTQLKAAVDWQPSRDAIYNCFKMRKLVQKILRDGNIKSTTDRSGEFQLWTLDQDMSLLPDGSEGYFGVGLISPVLAAHDDWQSTIAVVYDLLHAHFDILGTTKCGTHVHITPAFPGRLQWDVGELRRILKAVCLFDGSIDDMMPRGRKQCGYEPAFAMIYSIETTGDFAKLYPHRFYAFNFSRFGENQHPQGTVQFRRPPLSDSWETCAHWAVWTLDTRAI